MKLKYLIILLVINSLSTSTSVAQEIKLQAGIGRTTVKQWYGGEEDSEYVNPALGFNCGPIIEFKVSNNFLVKTGILLQLKGYNRKYSYEYDGTSSVHDETRYKFWYLDFPVLAKANFQLGKQAFIAEFGPYVGIGISASTHRITKQDDTVYDVKGKIPYGKIDDWGIENRANYGLMMSAGTKIKTAEIGILFDLGLSNSGFRESTFGEHELKHRVVSIYTSFPLLEI